MSSALSAVRAGIGGAILPKGDFSDVPGYGDLFTTLIEPEIELTASVLWPAEETLTPATAAVRDLLIAFVEKQCLASLATRGRACRADRPVGTWPHRPPATRARPGGVKKFSRVRSRRGP